ncbi:MAG: NUDIX hydrolase [Bacteroidales bacterium]|nr:NUDIX hydrolase [Bacteroidales bacterium]
MTYTYNYPRPAVTADIIILRKSNAQQFVLLIERKHPPFEGMWALPGGFLEMDETLEAAALRELREETGITGVELKQFHTFSKVNRDPRHRTITTVFIGYTDDNISVEAGDDAAKAQWFSTDKLPPLAFDHQEVMEMLKLKTGSTSL